MKCRIRAQHNALRGNPAISGPSGTVRSHQGPSGATKGARCVIEEASTSRKMNFLDAVNHFPLAEVGADS